MSDSSAVDPRGLAARIADVLVASAISDGHRATWLGPAVQESSGRRQVVLRTGDPTLYQGSAGIALACALAAGPLHRDDLLEVARRGARGALSAIRPGHGTGLYDGLTGVGLAALVVGMRAGDASLVADGRRTLDVAADRPAAGPELVRGAAGVALGLLTADRLDGRSRWQDAVLRHASEIVATADRRPWGWAWPLPEMEEPALCGLAHGAAGIAWALAEVEAVTRTAAVSSAPAPPPGTADAIDRALAFERSWFDRRRNTWPDLRTGLAVDPADGVPHPALWCHGAVGIGLSRLRLHELRPHPSLLAEAAAALQSSVAAAAGDPARPNSPDPHGLTVCHGLGGTLELLVTAHEALGEDEHLVTARWLLERAVAALGTDVERWPTGIDGSTWDPGLMTGLAGTMLVLLRIAEPGTVPGVGLLLTDMPRLSAPWIDVAPSTTPAVVSPRRRPSRRPRSGAAMPGSRRGSQPADLPRR